MPAWDDEEQEVSRPASPIAYVPPAKRFDDEDDEEEVLDNWEDDDSEAEREKEKAAKEAEERAIKAAEEAKANKVSRGDRMKQLSEQRQLEKAAESEAKAAASNDDTEDSKGDLRAEMRRREIESDLMHADDIFGNLGSGGTSGRPKKAKTATVVSLVDESGAVNGDSLDLANLPIFKPSTKADFDALASVLVPLITSCSSKKEYPAFIQHLAREISRPMTSEKVRLVISSLTTMSNEKMKEEKGPTKKSKAAKTKASLNVNSGRAPPAAPPSKIREEELQQDDDDDYFM